MFHNYSGNKNIQRYSNNQRVFILWSINHHICWTSYELSRYILWKCWRQFSNRPMLKRFQSHERNQVQRIYIFKNLLIWTISFAPWFIENTVSFHLPEIFLCVQYQMQAMATLDRICCIIVKGLCETKLLEPCWWNRTKIFKMESQFIQTCQRFFKFRPLYSCMYQGSTLVSDHCSVFCLRVGFVPLLSPLLSSSWASYLTQQFLRVTPALSAFCWTPVPSFPINHFW